MILVRHEIGEVLRDFRLQKGRTLRQVAWGGSWEGQTTIGVGTRARLPFKVTELTGPGDSTRLVIDVAHTW